MKNKNQCHDKEKKGNCNSDSNENTLSYYFLEPIIEMIPCGIIILKEYKNEKGEIELKYFVQNKIAQNLMGLDSEEYINKNFKEFPGIIPLHYIPKFIKVIENSKIFKGTFELSARQLCIETICSKYPDGLILILNDLTIINNLKNELKQSKTDLKESQSIACTGSFVWKFNENSLKCSDEVFNILEIDKTSENIYKKLENLVHPDDRKKVNITIKNVLQSVAPCECEFRILVTNNIEKFVICRLRSAFVEAGNPEQIFGSVTDITNQKRNEDILLLKSNELTTAYKKIEETKKELKKLNSHLKKEFEKQTKKLSDKNQQLEKVNKELDNFVYTASHDLKAPIFNIEGLLISLVSEMNSENAEAQYIIELLKLSVNKFKTTLHDLSEIAEVQKKEEDENFINCNAIFEDVKFSIHEEILKYGAIIETDFSEVTEIHFSRNSLRSIFHNLISNGLKYSSPLRRPEITISSHLEDDYIVLSFKDNGLGIKPEDKEKIFSVFQRIYTHVSGSGVGLYIVKRVVENNDGKIEVDSQLNKGSTFKIFFKKRLKSST